MARKVLRPCRRSDCPAPARTSILLDYPGRQITLVGLFEDCDPRFMELCPTHADGIQVPLGWSLVDERADRPEAGSPSAGDLGSAATVAVLATALQQSPRTRSSGQDVVVADVSESSQDVVKADVPESFPWVDRRGAPYSGEDDDPVRPPASIAAEAAASLAAMPAPEPESPESSESRGSSVAPDHDDRQLVLGQDDGVARVHGSRTGEPETGKEMTA